jgi:hypothetical protein
MALMGTVSGDGITLATVALLANLAALAAAVTELRHAQRHAAQAAAARNCTPPSRPPGGGFRAPPRRKHLAVPGPPRPPIWPATIFLILGRACRCRVRQALPARPVLLPRGGQNGPGRAGDVMKGAGGRSRRARQARVR